MGNIPQSLFELCPSAEDREVAYRAERYRDFREAIVRPDCVAVEPLNVPLLKILYDINAPLAIRDDLDTTGVKQILFAILRTERRDFGIVKSYGQDMPDNGLTFMAGLTDEPYDERPEYLTHLEPKHDIDMSVLGSDVIIRMDKNRGAWISKRYIRGKASHDSLITATKPLLDQNPDSILKQEVGIWAPPASELKSHARLVGRGLARAARASVAATEEESIRIVNEKPKAAAKKSKTRSRSQLRRNLRNVIEDGIAVYIEQPAV